MGHDPRTFAQDELVFLEANSPKSGADDVVVARLIV